MQYLKIVYYHQLKLEVHNLLKKQENNTLNSFIKNYSNLIDYISKINLHI